MKKMLVLLSVLAASGCVPGAPDLTPDQLRKVEEIQIYKEGSSPGREYNAIEKVSGVDCSGAPGGGRVWGEESKAIKIIKMKAVALDADAVVNVTCGSAPFVNNCWSAEKCDGLAVKWKK